MEWFNQVDQTYRTDLERINELNYARFDAKVDQRFAEFRAEFANLDARLGRQITALETRLIRWVIALWLATALGILGLLQLR